MTEIRTPEEYDAVLKQLNPLAVCEEGTLNATDQAELERLTKLIVDYDAMEGEPFGPIDED